MGVVAQISEGWRDFAWWIGLVTATLVLAGLIIRSKPGRWLAKNLVGEPMTEWIQREAVKPVVDLHQEAMVEKVTAIVEEVTTRVIHEHTQQEETLAGQLVGIVGRLDAKVDQALERADANGVQLDALVGDLERLKRAS